MADDSRKKPSAEIVQLTDDWMDFDIENLTVEELEQRLELSLINLPPILENQCGSYSCNCNSLCVSYGG